MPTNAFLPFATGNNANVLSDAAYPSSPVIAQGVQIGVADPQAANKAWRQSSVISAMIGQFIVDLAGVDANDSQSIATLEANFRAAILAAVAAGISGPSLANLLQLTNSAVQVISQNGVLTDVVMPVPPTLPAWLQSYDGTTFTIGQTGLYALQFRLNVRINISNQDYLNAAAEFLLNNAVRAVGNPSQYTTNTSGTFSLGGEVNWIGKLSAGDKVKFDCYAAARTYWSAASLPNDGTNEITINRLA